MKPYHLGRKAFKKGKLGNPYEQDTKDYRDYEFGFNKEYFENLKRVQRKEKLRARSSGVS